MTEEEHTREAFRENLRRAFAPAIAADEASNETGKATEQKWRIGYNHDQIVDDDGTVLAVVSRTGAHGSMTDADQARAHRIVRAVNSHDKLVEACDALLECVLLYQDEDLITEHQVFRATRLAEAVLESAK